MGVDLGDEEMWRKIWFFQLLTTLLFTKKFVYYLPRIEIVLSLPLVRVFLLVLNIIIRASSILQVLISLSSFSPMLQ